jgi:hypothetical protein
MNESQINDKSLIKSFNLKVTMLRYEAKTNIPLVTIRFRSTAAWSGGLSLFHCTVALSVAYELVFIPPNCPFTCSGAGYSSAGPTHGKLFLHCAPL